ncbi:MAG: LysR family hydrogen peroxide-inducible transcriptional activator [Paracoccaceae bacterium]|jgi:LysR family hydrogen peroxide-inducible transcriptional activator
MRAKVPMDLIQINYFLHLADALNFTEAARRSGVAQPSLTRAIRKLEDELGGPLLYRDGKDTRLTALGREVQVEFMRLEKGVQTVRELAENSVRGRRRVLTLGVAATIAPSAITGFLTYAMSELPTIEIKVHAMQPGESENEVLAGKYDGCFLPQKPKQNFKLAVQPLYSENLMLAFAETHPLAAQVVVSPKQMAEQPYMDRLNCEFHSQIVAHFMDREILMRPRFSSEREDWVQQMVQDGSAVCIMPERSAYLPGIVLRPVEGLDLARDVAFVVVSGSGSPMELRQIFEMSSNYNWG